MEIAPQNTMMKSAPENKDVDGKQDYFYPDAGKTIRAASQTEADEALAKITSEATINV